MATIGIWKIEKRLDHVITYTTNTEKTINSDYEKENYNNLHNVIEYTQADYKTEKQFFVSSLNCNVSTAFEEMKITKEQYGKTNGILGFHAFQSFKESEVTPEQAHEIGIKLAEEMWGDRFEVIISTHLNTKHYHNHFVINSVSFKDGNKYYDTRETYAHLRELSNAICQEAGISFFKEKTCRKNGINYGNYYAGFVEKNNYYTITKEDIDRAIAQAYSYVDFESLLKAMNYELIYRADKLSVRREPYKKNIRVHRCFGVEYTKEKIEERIENTHAPREPFIEEYANTKKYSKYSNYKKQKSSGLYALYLHYCYLLKVFPTKYPRKQLSPEMRLEIKKMEQISNETELLVSKEIKTYKQFFIYKGTIIKELASLVNQRETLWSKYNKSKDKEEQKNIRIQINDISNKIKLLRKEVVLCDGIDERLPKIEYETQKHYEKFSGKEMEENAIIR